MVHPKIMIISGGSTSDLYGAELARNLKMMQPEVGLEGIGGANMLAAGVEILYDITEMDNVGLFGSLKGAPLVKRLVQKIGDSMERSHPDVVVQIGLPVSNHRLLDLAHSRGIPIVYYNTPLGLGGGEYKPERLARLVDKVACVTLTEHSTCKAAGLDAVFVGHPLLDLVKITMTRSEARTHWQLSSDPMIALFPGVRELEIKHVLPSMLKARQRIKQEMPSAQFVVSQAPGIRRELINEYLARHDASDLLVVDDIYNLLNAADLSISTCGTACLEAALIGTPVVAVYKAPTGTYLMDKMIARKSCLTTPNLLLGKQVIPELLQTDFTSAKVAKHVLEILQDPEMRNGMLEDFKTLQVEFGEPGSLRKTASIILQTIGGAQLKL